MKPKDGPRLSPMRVRAQAYAEERAGRISQAIALLKESVEGDPDEWRNVRMLADLLTRAGQRKAANEHYRRLAENCELEQLHTQAIAVWKRILANEPDSSGAHLKLGELYGLAGLRADARKHYETALEQYRKGGRTREVAQVEAHLARLHEPSSAPPEASDQKAPAAQEAPPPEPAPLPPPEPAPLPPPEPAPLPQPEPAPAAPEREERGDAGHQIGRDDYEVRYNLGVAYREMGLLEEAIVELQLAAADPGRLAECASMLAECFVEQEKPARAVRWLEKGLTVPGLASQQRRGLRYHLAAAFEACGEASRALGIYRELQEEDAGFRDVAKKVRRLSEATDPSTPAEGE